MAVVEVWTDGSCDNSDPDGWAGWAACLYSPKTGRTRTPFSGGRGHTNQSAEIMAVIWGLSFIKGEGHTIRIHTDSKYVIHAFTEGWIKKWRSEGWGTIKHRALWETLEGLVELHDVTWHHVKGHSGVIKNELVDMKANAGRHMAKMEWIGKEAAASARKVRYAGNAGEDVVSAPKGRQRAKKGRAKDRSL